MRSFGRQPQKPLFIVVMISLYCSVVSAFVFMFMGIPSEKFVISRRLVRILRAQSENGGNHCKIVFVKSAFYELCGIAPLLWGAIRFC